MNSRMANGEASEQHLTGERRGDDHTRQQNEPRADPARILRSDGLQVEGVGGPGDHDLPRHRVNRSLQAEFDAQANKNGAVVASSTSLAVDFAEFLHLEDSSEIQSEGLEAHRAPDPSP